MGWAQSKGSSAELAGASVCIYSAGGAAEGHWDGVVSGFSLSVYPSSSPHCLSAG